MDFGLTLAVPPQPVCTQIDLIAVVVNPTDRMAKFVNLDPRETRGILQRAENPALRQQGPQVNDAFIPIEKHEFQDTWNDRLGGFDAW